MAKSTRSKKKSKAKTKPKGKPGRQRTTGAGTPMVVRMHKPQIKLLDQWIETQPGPLTRPEAIRRLVMQRLSPEPEQAHGSPLPMDAGASEQDMAAAPPTTRRRNLFNNG